MSNRHGFSLAELIVGLVVASLVSASLVQLMVVQSRFLNTQEGRANARAVSRGALTLIESDLRMVQTSAGVVAASPNSITIRVPFAVGVICGTQGSSTTFMLPPVDSLVLAEGMENIAGYGWRNSTNTLTWAETSVSFNSGNPPVCAATATDPAIEMIPGGRLVSMTPSIAGSYRGAAVFLHQRITYSFAASTSVPGRTGLFRAREGTGDNEELVAPFDATAGFRFFVAGNADAVAAAPADLSDLRGIELNLVGVNERAPAGTAGETAPLRTAVFFKN